MDSWYGSSDVVVSRLRIVLMMRMSAHTMTKATMTRKMIDSVPWIIVLRTIARVSSILAGSVSVGRSALALRCCWK